MADQKTVFIAFAKEDEGARNLLSGQKVNADTPFEFIDISVKEPTIAAGRRRRVPGSAGAMVRSPSSQ